MVSISHYFLNTKRLNAYYVFLAYAIITYIGISYHEIWKDEAHHWLLGRDSSSLQDLLFNTRYEGHPILWNLLLYYLSKLTSNPFGMQLLHWAISLTIVWLIIFKSPFPRSIRYLLPFSYFFLFEYGIVSRNYAVLTLLAFTACHAILNIQRGRYYLTAFILALLANTHLFGLIFSGTIALFFYWREYETDSFNQKRGSYFTSIFVVTFGYLLAVWQIIPPEDHFLTVLHNDTPWLSFKRITKLGSIPARSLFHIPTFWQENFWNTNVLLNYGPYFTKGLIVIIGWCVPLMLFYKAKKTLALSYLALIPMAIFAYISPLHLAVRHCGVFFIVIICCYWLISYLDSERSAYACSPKTLKIIIIYLIMQVFMGITVLAIDINRPFSQGKQVVDYLKNTDLDHLPVVSTQNNGQSLSAYLSREIFYAEKNDFGSFAIWNVSSFDLFDRDQMMDNIKAFSKKNERFLVIVEFTLQNNSFPGINIAKIASFERSVVRSENFNIYLFEKI